MNEYMMYLDLEDKKKEIIKERGKELDFYVLIYNTKTTDYLNSIEFQTYEDALKKFYITNTNNIDVVVEIMFSPQKDDEKYYDNVVIMKKEMVHTMEDLKNFGCSKKFIRKVWQLPTDKLYQVVHDRQGGMFGFDRQYTVRDWVCQAVEWLYMDESNVNANLPFLMF